MNPEVNALRAAADDLEKDLNAVQEESLQRVATSLTIAVGWLRRRADRIEAK